MRIDQTNNIIYFDNDEEFYDYCVETYSINRRVRDQRIRKAGWDFSDWYQSHVNDATKIVILDDDSTILRRSGMVACHAVTRKINAYRVNPVEPENPELLMEVERSQNYFDINKTSKNESMNREQCLQQLRESFTFQMSLGSKELFHSNFLQWLSVIDWKGFMIVLHKLSGVQNFWWEGEDVHPDNENVEVRRESNNFDLSVYILTGYTKPRKGGEPQKKWCPVFILENKVKSMPYQHQLDDYANKAFKEWKVGKKKWETLWTDQPVSFVLLTLFDEVAIKESQIDDSEIKVTWEKRNYSDLSEILKGKILTNKKDLTKKVIGDYRNFIEALHDLSQSDDWKVYGNEKYQNHILRCGEEEKKLRIADLREKVHHERMLKLLESKLNEALPNLCEHWSKEKEYIDKNKTYHTGKAFINTSFSRGLGITEVFVIINNSYRLMIQLQSNQYRKCLITHIIPEETKEQLNERQKRISEGLSNSIWCGYTISHSFGKHFKYDYKPEQIGQKSVGEILNKVVVDIKSIMENMDKLEQLR